MKKNNNNQKNNWLDILLSVMIGSALCYGTLFMFFLYANVPFSALLTILTLGGGGLLGGVVGNKILNKLEENAYCQDADNEYGYDEYLEEEEYEEELDSEYEKNRSKLRVVKGSNFNNSYQYNDSIKPKLEIVNFDEDEKKGKKR